MELELIRKYYPWGTSGILLLNEQRVCYTVEQAWRNNRHTSCIPEGRYSLQKSCLSTKDWILQVENVRSRKLISIRALQDSIPVEGSIVPVSLLVGRGRGILSVVAMQKLLAIVACTLEKNQPLFVTIKSK